MDIFSIGELVIDFIPGSEEGSYIRNAGGAPANVAIAVAKNGLSAGFCGKVGNDDFGRFLIKILQDNKVSVLCKTLCETAITTMAFVTLTKDGERSFTFARKPGADMLLELDEVKEEDLKNAKIIYSGSCALSKSPTADAAVYALKIGHELGKMVVFDINYRNLMWDDDKEAAIKKVREILPFVDILKLSEEELDMVGGEDNIIAMMSANNISLSVLTLGEKGARCYFGKKVFDIAGKKAEIVVDATGAGDAFFGGFLSCLIYSKVDTAKKLTEDIIRNAVSYGNVSGYLCVKQKGAISSLPSRDEILKIMEGGA